MADVLTFPDGGYRFLRGVFPYSAGVAAEPGMEIERARFFTPAPLHDGFRRIEAHLTALSRPLTALCAAELRSPRPLTASEFRDFNREYVAVLEAWGIFRDGVNPIARSNVCPEIGPPPAPSFYAFSYTVSAQAGARPSFHIAGSGEMSEGEGTYPGSIIRHRDLSADAVREKACWVLTEMERRLEALGFGWQEVTATQMYTVHDVYPFLANEIARRGVMRNGLTWHFARPPLVDLEYEMDCRSVTRELVL